MNDKIKFTPLFPMIIYFIPDDLFNMTITSRLFYHLVSKNIDQKENWLKNLIKMIKECNMRRKVMKCKIGNPVKFIFRNEFKPIYEKIHYGILIKKKSKWIKLHINNHGKLKIKYTDITMCSKDLVGINNKYVLYTFKLAKEFKCKKCVSTIRDPWRKCTFCI